MDVGLTRIMMTIPRDAIVVDRIPFINWTQGILLDFKNGKGIVSDKVEYEEAEEALKKGKTIYLRYNGKVVTYMKKIGDEYREFLF